MWNNTNMAVKLNNCDSFKHHWHFCTYIHTYINTCIHIHACLHTFYMHTYVCTCIHKCIHIYWYMLTHTQTDRHTHIYKQIYINTCTRKLAGLWESGKHDIHMEWKPFCSPIWFSLLYEHHISRGRWHGHTSVKK